jgi:hypothetical protein
MMALLNIAEPVDRPTMIVGMIGLTLLTVGFFWVLFRWLTRGPLSADPWDVEVSEAMEADDATPICHRCLERHLDGLDFCPNCGAAVGHYTNYLPFPRLFSLGHELRIGTCGEYKRSRLNIFGFILLSLAEYFVVAPLYWVLMWRALRRKEAEGGSGESAGASSLRENRGGGMSK